MNAIHGVPGTAAALRICACCHRPDNAPYANNYAQRLSGLNRQGAGYVRAIPANGRSGATIIVGPCARSAPKTDGEQ